MIKIVKDGWHEGHELRLVPGGNRSDTILTQAILKILKEEFLLTGAKIVPVYQKNPPEDKYLKGKDRLSLVNGTFPIGEARIDVGRTTLESHLDNVDAAYYITHPYNLKTGPDVATTVEQIKSFGDLLIDNNIRVRQLSLVTPIGPYDLNHSVARKKHEGILEANLLKRYMRGVSRTGYDEIIAIASHSEESERLANEYRMHFRNINPFRGPWAIPDPKLGPFMYTSPDNTELREDHDIQRARLMPFLSLLKEKYADQNIYFLATDDGIYQTMSEMAYALTGTKQNVLAVDKERLAAGEIIIKGTKHYSTANLDQLKGAYGIMIDDRILSGGTMNDIASTFKQYGLEKLIGIIACDMATSPDIMNNSPFDDFYILETQPNSHIAKNKIITRLPIETTALLLSAEIYDSYVNFRQTGKTIKVR